MKGADGVLITGCRPNECHYDFGNAATERRMEAMKDLIRDAGLDPRRLRVEWMSAGEGERYAGVVKDFLSELKELGSVGVELE